MDWNRLRYGLYAPVYDLVGGRLASARRRSIALLDLQAGERVLLVGAGTGLDLPLLPSGADVTAIDVSGPMLRRAERRARKLGRGVDCRIMDAQAMDLPGASFDAVVLHLVLSVVPDPLAAAREVGRILRPGGRAAVFDKFLPQGAAPSLGRRAIGAVANVVFSDINRTLEPLLDAAGLVVVHDEPSYGGGLYRIVTARKPDGAAA